MDSKDSENQDAADGGPDNESGQHTGDNGSSSSPSSGLISRLKQPRVFLSLLATLVVGVFFIGLLGDGGRQSGPMSADNPGQATFRVTEPGIMDLRSKDARPHPLVFNFSLSVAPLEAIGKELTSGVSIQPAIAGHWQWNSGSRLTFVPEVNWLPGEEYEVEFAESIFPDHIELADYDYEFTTDGLSGKLRDVALHQDPVDRKIKKFVATVRFTHQVNQADFAEQVKLRLRNIAKGVPKDERDYPFEINWDETGSEAYIVSDTVPIPERDQEFELLIDGARTEHGEAKMTSLKGTQRVPGMFSYFRVSSSQVKLVRNEQNDPEQVLILETTDDVHADRVRDYLKVWLLPDYFPAQPGRKRQNLFSYRVEQVDASILKLGQPVELKFIPSERDSSKVHSIKLDVIPGRQLYVQLGKGLESSGGYILADGFASALRIPTYPREVGVMAEGGLLSLSGQKKLSIVSRGNEAVQIEVRRVRSNQIHHLVSQTSGDFQNPHFRNYNFNEDNLSERYTVERSFPAVKPGKSQYTSFDFQRYLQSGQKHRNGVFFVEVRGWDPRRKRQVGPRDRRMVLVSDLGMIIKDNADGSHEAFVMSLKTGRPVAGAQVSVIGKNGLSIYKQPVNERGTVHVPNLRNKRYEKTATAFVVEHAGDMSFMPYNRMDRRLDLSRFDIGGIRAHGKKDSLRAFLFSDRGIYRPGDTFNIGMIIKSDNWKRRISGLPLEYVITDPRGLVIKRNKFTLSQSGFEELSYTTMLTSLTGNYNIKLYLIKERNRNTLLGSTNVKVEEFLPDRMKISARFSKERALGWVHPNELKALVNLQNLYGTAATDRRIASRISLSPSRPRFAKFKGYRFFDPAKADKSFSEFLPDAKTDENGEATLDLNLARFQAASYRLNIKVSGFEAEGGRSVATERQITISPREFMLGYHADGNLGYVSKDSQRAVKFIAVNNKLEQIAASGLQLQLIENRYVSALIKQDNGTYQYQSVLKEYPVKTIPFSVEQAGSQYALPTDRSGEFVAVIKDAQDTELSRVKFSVAGASNVTGNLEKNAELKIRLNKQDYRAGEAIKVHISAPYTGSGLITIERDKVYAHKWFTTTSTSSVQTITLPSGVEGNAYVNVNFVRSLDSREIFMSPLSYGIEGFTVNRDKRRTKLTIDIPDLVRPGKQVNIAYKSNKPGKIVVFGVDEGILQVEKYKTPDPLKFFFQKRALEVNTSQILDLLLPEFNIVRKLAAAGGGSAADALSKNLNPFQRKRNKPVAFWSGVIDTSGSGNYQYTVPDYFNGSMRIMAVAVTDDSVGAASANFLVRGHFVLSPNVPTFVAPGDEFTISANVANNVEESGQDAKVDLELKVSKHLQVLEQDVVTLDIPEGREKVARFKLKAGKAMLGSATMAFTASLEGKSSTTKIDLSVRPAMPYRTTVKGGHVRDGNLKTTLDRQMYPQFRTRQFSASPLPLSISRGLISYLDKYPYLCTEQLVSRAAPAIALNGYKEFGYDAGKAQKHLDILIGVLRTRQNNEGAFGYWAANSFISPFISAYAMDILLEAREKGLAVPADMIQRGENYLNKLSRKNFDDLHQARARAYAIYVLTRSGKVTTRLLNELNELMNNAYPGKWDNDLVRIYMAAAYKMLHLDEQAWALMKTVKASQPIIADYNHFYDQLMHDAQYLYLLSRHFKDRITQLPTEFIVNMTQRVNKGRYNTLSSSTVIRALAAYAGAALPAMDYQFTLTGITADNRTEKLHLPDGLMPRIDIREAISTIQAKNSKDIPIFYQTTEAGFELTLPMKEEKHGLEVQREFRDVDNNAVTHFKLGDEIKVVFKLRSLDGARHRNVAIVDMLPGGFEVSRDPNKLKHSWKPDYRDVREDRVLLFGSVDDQAREYSYIIKATNRGRFTVPPTFIESMYNRELYALGKADVIVVE